MFNCLVRILISRNKGYFSSILSFLLKWKCKVKQMNIHLFHVSKIFRYANFLNFYRILRILTSLNKYFSIACMYDNLVFFKALKVSWGQIMQLQKRKNKISFCVGNTFDRWNLNMGEEIKYSLHFLYIYLFYTHENG